jgi:type IV pilus assembly protein PilQ
MNKIRQCCGIALLIGSLWIFLGMFSAGNAMAETPATAAAVDVAGKPVMDVGALENITLARAKSKESITCVATKISTFTVEEKTGNSILLKLENLQVPESLLRPFNDDVMINVRQVLPEHKIIEGKPWVYMTIDLKQSVPYSVRQEGQNVVVDFNVSSLAVAAASAEKSETLGKAIVRSPEDQKKKKMADNQATKNNSIIDESPSTMHTSQRISLDFQDADIHAVLRLLAETGGVSIVAGPDVKGSVSVNMRNVPWDQALETILYIQGLVKKDMGDVISVMTLEKKRKEDETRKAAEKAQAEAEASKKDQEKQAMAERGKLKQISIEAKIIDASDEFVRNLGVTWGGAFNAKIGGHTYQTSWGTGQGSSTGTKTYNYPNFNDTTSQYPSWMPYTTTNDGSDITILRQAAVNLPGAVTGPSLGFVIGGANAMLEAQIAANEETDMTKTISSPKITTMDGVKAIIKQGEEIPYTTIENSGGTVTKTITFKDALLKLEVTPTITPDGRISMQISATNDTRGETVDENGNVSINKSEINSKVVVEDGTTIVMGGVSKTYDKNNVTGVPWLCRIPVLGWLFKQEGVDKRRRQILIFITPKIIPESEKVPLASVN